MVGDRAPSNRITVIIAVRNGMPFVLESVRSALAQHSCGVEVVVVDDGSTDGTADAVAAIGDPRLTCIRNAGRGVSSARESGVAASSAEWLMFLDADDCLAADALASLIGAASPDAVAIYGDYERIDAEGRRIGRRNLMRARRTKPSGSVLPDMLSGNFIINGGVLLCRREAYLRSGGFDPALSLCEDWHLWCRLATLGPFVYLPMCVMKYRVHASSVMMHTRRTYADFEPALRAIFSNPLVIAQTDVAERAKFRRRGEASLMTYCAQQALRGRALAEGRRLGVAALRRHPRRTPWIIARLAGAMAGL